MRKIISVIVAEKLKYSIFDHLIWKYGVETEKYARDAGHKGHNVEAKWPKTRFKLFVYRNVAVECGEYFEDARGLRSRELEEIHQIDIPHDLHEIRIGELSVVDDETRVTDHIDDLHCASAACLREQILEHVAFSVALMHQDTRKDGRTEQIEY